jgi:putative tricarboxylic transport membrane protein
MQLSDRITGLFIVGIGALAAYGGSRLPPVPGQQIGPSVFPMVVGVGLVLCGALIMLRVGHGFEDPAPPSEPGPDGVQEVAPGGRHPALVLLPPALLVFYVLAVDRLGFIPTAAAMLIVGAAAFGARPRLFMTMALVAPVVVHFLFAKLLRVPLPAGLLPKPW